MKQVLQEETSADNLVLCGKVEKWKIPNVLIIESLRVGELFAFRNIRCGSLRKFYRTCKKN